MALSAIGFAEPQFYRGAAAETATPPDFSQKSKDLSAAVDTLRAPQVLPAPARASTGTQMATLCLVQPSDNAAGGGSALSTALDAYTTVVAE